MDINNKSAEKQLNTVAIITLEIFFLNRTFKFRNIKNNNQWFKRC